MNRANEMRNIFKVLCRIAEETGCAVILIGHLNKNVSAGVQQRSLGSSDITNAVRNVLTVVKINNDDERRLMCQTKNNLAPLAKSVEFVLDKETGFRFVGISDMKYEDAVSMKSKNNDEDDENYETKQELAERKIIEYLTDNGATESDTVKSFVMSFGIGEKTYNNARSSLKEKGITKVYKGSSSWMIELAKR